MGKIGLGVKFGELMGKLAIPAVGGSAAFFGFEWLTNGGLQDSVSGATGLDELTSSILTLAAAGVAIIVIFKVLGNRLDKKGGR